MTKFRPGTATSYSALAPPSQPHFISGPAGVRARTHWIWQDGERLTRNPLPIVDGWIDLPTTPGLGIELDMEEVARANRLYREASLGGRNDAAGMQYLIPEWKFDPKRPCLVR